MNILYFYHLIKLHRLVWFINNALILEGYQKLRVIVVGAGPAGASAAYNAAKQGHEVLLFEKNSSLALKPCGEGTFGETFGFVDLKPSSEFVVNEVKTADFYLKDFFVASASLKSYDRRAYMLDKQKFLEVIVSNAENETARVFFNRKVTEINPFKGIVWVKSQKYEADLIILADGATSLLSRRLLRENNYPYASTITYMNVELNQSINAEKALFYFFNDGYGWVFPKSEKIVNIGVGGLKSNLKEKIRKLLKKYSISKLNRIKGAPVPVGGIKKPLRIGKVNIVGDAAGMVMPVTGEGIRFALMAGRLAIDEDYQEIIGKKLMPNFKNALKMLHVFINKLSDSERKKAIKALVPYVDVILDGRRPPVGVLRKLGLRFVFKLI